MRTKMLLLAALGAAVLSGPALAGSVDGGDYVYADSFGNLVIESGAGYKRIVVGQGHRAREMQQLTATEEPEVVYADQSRVRGYDCYRPGQWLQGRSYMYGLSYGDAPPMAACR